MAERIRALEARRRESEERSAELALARKAVAQELAQRGRERERLEQVRETVQREAAQFEEELERCRTQQGELTAELARWQETRARLEGGLGGLRSEAEAARAELQALADALTERKVEHAGLGGAQVRHCQAERVRVVAHGIPRGRRLELQPAQLTPGRIVRLERLESRIDGQGSRRCLGNFVEHFPRTEGRNP